LKRKLITLGSIVIAISIVIIITVNDAKISSPTESQNISEIQKADIVMPTKVSRPGCDEIDRCYVPSKITITKGQSVTWQNEDAAFHSVTSGFYDAPDGLFDSGYLDPYQYFSFTFDNLGTFDYYCTLHPWMKGQVLVE
jgi:plastocyanin